MDLKSHKPWQDIFTQYTVPEIRTIKDGLALEAESKKQELRLVIGERYRDLLKTADLITSMESTVSSGDATLAELCHTKHYRLWTAGVTNAARFSDPMASDERKSRLRKQAIISLLRSTILLIKDELVACSNLITLSRAIALADLLIECARSDNCNIQRYSSQLKLLKNEFNSFLNGALLEGRTDIQNSKKSVNSSTDIFLAFMTTTGKNTEELLNFFLQHRLEFIKRSFDDSSASIIECLKIISSTITLTEQTFGKRQVQKAAYQQSESYTLLKSPELASKVELNVEKFTNWLPDVILQAPCIPQTSTKGLSLRDSNPSATRADFVKILEKFGYDVMKFISNCLTKVFSGSDNLAQLITLHSDILELLRDSIVLRTLKAGENDNQIWFDVYFRPHWTRQFTSLVEENVRTLLSAESLIQSTFQRIINRESEPLSSLSIFSKSSEFFSLDMNGPADSQNLNSLFKSLEDFSLGKAGDIREVSHQFEQWCKTISNMKQQIEEVHKLKGYVTISYSDDDSYDEHDSSERWRTSEKEELEKNYKLFLERLGQTIVEVYQSLVKSIKTLATPDNARAIVFKLKCALELDFHCSKLMNGQLFGADKEFLDETFKTLADMLLDGSLELDIDKYDKIDTRLWQSDNSTRFPATPSLFILASLSNFVNGMSAVLGNDDLTWNYEGGLTILREKLASRCAEKLQKALREYKEKAKTRESEKSEWLTDEKESVGNEQNPIQEENGKDNNQNATTDVNGKDHHYTDGNSLDVISQIYADHFYILSLLSFEPLANADFYDCLDNSVQRLINEGIKGSINRTRLLFVPLAI